MKKRSVRIAGHDTSISLEEPFWEALKAEAQLRGVSMDALVSQIDAQNGEDVNLSSSLRIFVLQSLQKRLQQS